MSCAVRLDRVFTYGDKLSFLIPHEWVEFDEQENYLYQAPDSVSGWFRVSLITVTVTNEHPSKRLERLFPQLDSVIRDEESGNLIERWEKETEEAGNRIHIYYWKVANWVVPDEVREALFSYTVLAERIADDENKRLVNLLFQLVSRAQFAEVVAEQSNQAN